MVFSLHVPTQRKPLLDDGMVKCPALCYIRIKDVMYTQFLLHRKKRYNHEGGWETEAGRLPHTRAPGGGLALVLGAFDIWKGTRRDDSLCCHR